MDAFLLSIGASGFFAARAFLPAFVLALVLRFGDELPFLSSSEFLRALPDAPTWFTSWPALLVLGALATLEVLASKSSDARAVLAEVDQYLKPGLAVLTTLGIASVTDAEFVRERFEQAGLGDGLLAALVGVTTFSLASLRNGLVGLLVEGDEDDDAGVQGLLSWAEDVLSLVGPLLLVIYTLEMALLVAATSALLFWVRKRAEAKEDASRIPCASCGAPTYRCAVRCGRCGTELAAPAAVGFFGTALRRPAPDRAAHPYRLVEKKRCSACATRLPERDPEQACPACGRIALVDPAFVDAYLGSIAARLPAVLGVCLLFSLVPIAGLLPGVIYYRMALVAPFRRYIPRGKSLLLKWGIRLLFLVLVAIQWFPGLGGIVVPLMAFVNYGAWRGLFLAQISAARVAPATG